MRRTKKVCLKGNFRIWWRTDNWKSNQKLFFRFSKAEIFTLPNNLDVVCVVKEVRSITLSPARVSEWKDLSTMTCRLQRPQRDLTMFSLKRATAARPRTPPPTALARREAASFAEHCSQIPFCHAITVKPVFYCIWNRSHGGIHYIFYF